MTPSLADYLRGLRRLWWIPVLTLLLGGGLSLYTSATAQPSVHTEGNILFKFKIADQGQESAGSAREAEATVASLRLRGYIQLVLASQPLHELMATQGITQPPTTTSASTGQPVDDSARVVIAPQEGGVVVVRLENEDLGQPDATRLTRSIAEEVARSVIAADSLQASPALEPDPVVAEPQRFVRHSSSILQVALPVVLLLIGGLAVVYVVAWRKGWVWDGRDVEERLGARTLGDSAGRPADGTTIALAIAKNRAVSTSVLLVPVGPVPAAEARAVGELVATAWSNLGRPVTLAAATDFEGTLSGSPDELRVTVAADGLDAEALRASVVADVVGLLVGYGRTRYTDLVQTGRALAKVTDADIAVVGLAK